MCGDMQQVLRLQVQAAKVVLSSKAARALFLRSALVAGGDGAANEFNRERASACHVHSQVRSHPQGSHACSDA